MATTEQEYLTELVKHAADTRSLLSNKRKKERECMVVRATLRMLNVPFAESEIIANPKENSDVDVCFRTARFQVKDITGDRKRGDEWRERETRWKAAKTIEGTSEPSRPSEPVSFEDTTRWIAKVLGAKLYSDRSKLDALVSVDANRRIYAASPELRFAPPAALAEQGWRCGCAPSSAGTSRLIHSQTQRIGTTA